MQNENRLKISNPERITRILRRICQATLPVMVRDVSDAAVAVKGRAAGIHLDPSKPGLRVSNVSDKGVAYLMQKPRKLQIEFIMMSTKVMFVASVLAAEQNSILVSLPTSLVSIERRKNARFNCTEDLVAMLDMSVWKAAPDDLTAPPFFSQYQSLSTYIAIGDLSLGGLCAVARFPAVNTVLKRGLIDDRAKLVLPMQDPIEVGVEIRWCKRIREHAKPGESGEQLYQRFFRFGVEFITKSEALDQALRRFIQQLTQADAI